MQETLITMDAALSARLQSCRQLFQRLDAGTAGEPFVRMPDGDAAPLSLTPGKGLRAAGALLSYALLGREASDAAEQIAALARDHADRSIRRACQTAADMLREDPAFSPAGLYAALRAAVVFLPDGPADGILPGLLQSRGAASAGQSASFSLSARYAWADSAAIAYFDLPPGVEEASIGETVYTRAQCHFGVCLPPDCAEITVEWAGGSAVLRPADPLNGLRLAVGFQWSRLFLPANRTPKRLWRKKTPCIRVQGPVGAKTPAMTLITSAGTVQESAAALPQGAGSLRCPPLDPQQDTCVELRLPGVRYLDLKGEG